MRSTAALVAVCLIAVSCTGGQRSAVSSTTIFVPATVTTISDTTISDTTMPSTGPPRDAVLVPRQCDTSSNLPPTTCYWLEVPERRDRPTSRTIRLWVAVIKGVGAPADTTPGIFLNGGPGYAASTPFVSGNIQFAGEPGISVVFDQRGSGRSEPRLDCPELHTRLDATHSWAERVDASHAAVLSCSRTLQADGIDLNGYNAIESAADIVDLRKALGYTKWIVGGISYGGRLAREVYRQDPTGVAGLVLESAVTTAPVGPVGLIRNANSAIQRITAACDAQPKCSSANGSLDVDLETAAKLLDTTPFIIPANGSSPASTTVGDDLYNGAIQAMYRSDLIPALPVAAHALSQGDNSVLTAFAGQVNPSPSADPRDDMAEADSEIMVCADEGAAMTQSDLASLAAPGRWSTLVLSWPYLNCGSWNVDPVPGGRLAPVTGDVPVLAVYGQLDPVTPPVFADEIRSQFPNATITEYPGGGHGVLFMNDCATQIATAFYDQPGSHIDTSCVAALAPPFSS